MMFGMQAHVTTTLFLLLLFSLLYVVFYMRSGDQIQVPVLLTKVSPQILASSFLIRTNLVLLIISIINLFLFSNV